MTVDAVKILKTRRIRGGFAGLYLAARIGRRRLQAAGFTELVETEASDPADRNRPPLRRPRRCDYRLAGGAKAQKASGYRALGVHTDRPPLKVKPLHHHEAGWHQIAVENYGGAPLNLPGPRAVRGGPPTVLEGGGSEGPPGGTGPIAHPAAGAAPGPQAQRTGAGQAVQHVPRVGRGSGGE